MGYYYYKSHLSGIIITNYIGDRKNVHIPSTINGHPVIAIGNYFNYGDFTVYGAFDSKGITNLILPNSLAVIESVAFRNNSLSNVTLPFGVETIGSGAFANNRLEKISLPSSIVDIEGNAFKNNMLTEVALPNKLQLIHGELLAGNPLEKIKIPDSVRIISQSAFDDTTLTSVELPIHLKERLLAGTFKTNPTITYRGTPVVQKDDLAIPNPDTDFLWSERSGKMSIEYYFGTRKNVHIPDTIDGKKVLHIGGRNSNAFENQTTYGFQAKGITGLRLPSQLEFIGWGEFQNNNLTTLQIPESVTVIQGHAFINNPLTNVELPWNSLKYSQILLAFDEGVILTYPGGNNFTKDDLTVPNPELDFEWTVLGDNTIAITAYYGARRHVHIPSTINGLPVSSISGLRDERIFSVYIPDTISQIYDNAFSGNRLTTVELPAHLRDKGYESGVFDSGVTITYRP